MANAKTNLLSTYQLAVFKSVTLAIELFFHIIKANHFRTPL